MGYFGLFGGYFAPGTATCIEKINCYMNMVIDRRAAVKTFVIFRYFLVSLFVKSTFLATQEELEALLWICFTPRIVFLIFKGKIFFRRKNRRKKSWRKKISDFF